MKWSSPFRITESENYCSLLSYKKKGTGPSISTLCVLFYFFIKQGHEIGTVIPCLQISKLRLREGRGLAQGHI